MIGIVNKDITISSDKVVVKKGTYVHYTESTTPMIYCTDGINDFFTEKEHVSPITLQNKFKQFMYLINNYP